MIGYSGAAEIRRNVGRVIAPPLRQTVFDTAVKSLRVRGRGGSAERWSSDLTPYMEQPMRAMTQRRYESVVFVGPARTGKTTAFDALIAHAIVADPADMLAVHMTQDTARDHSRLRLDPMIRQSPDVAAAMSRHAKDDNTYDKYTKAGTVVKIAWPSIKQLSGKEFRVVAATDYDRIPDDIGGEGDLYGLMLKRATTFLSSAIAYIESSPGKECTIGNWRPAHPHDAPPAGGIIGLYNRSTKQRWYWPCLECREWMMVPADLSLFALPDHDELEDMIARANLAQMARDAAIVACRQCGAMHEQRHRRELNARSRWLAAGQKLSADGELIGIVPDAAIDGYYLGGAAAAYQTWVSMIRNYLTALREFVTMSDEVGLKRTITQDQGGVFFPRAAGQGKSPHELEARAEYWTRLQVPVGVRLLLGLVDVQHNRFVVQIMGYGPGRERWLIDRYNLSRSERNGENGKPEGVQPGAYPEDWRLLLPLIDKSYPLADGTGRRMRLRAVACDSGGADATSANAYQFWRLCRIKKLSSAGPRGRFFLVKGGSKKDAPRAKESWPDSSERKDRRMGGRGDVPVWLLNTTMVKDTIAADLCREIPGPGYLHTPSWIETWWYEELTREQRTEKGWSEASKNEAWDLACYGDALYHILGLESVKWDRPPAWAAEWDINSLVFEGDAVSADRPTNQIKRPPRSPLAKGGPGTWF